MNKEKAKEVVVGVGEIKKTPKLSDKQMENYMEKMKTNMFGRAIKQKIDQSIENLNSVHTIQDTDSEENMASVVLARKMAMHFMLRLKQELTEDLADKKKCDTIQSEYE